MTVREDDGEDDGRTEGGRNNGARRPLAAAARVETTGRAASATATTVVLVLWLAVHVPNANDLQYAFTKVNYCTRRDIESLPLRGTQRPSH